MPKLTLRELLAITRDEQHPSNGGIDLDYTIAAWVPQRVGSEAIDLSNQYDVDRTEKMLAFKLSRPD